MGCRDDGYEQEYAAEQAKRHHRVTRILCELMGQLERAGILCDYSSADGHVWWEDHKEQDRKRHEAEALRKLEEEKRLLKQIQDAEAEIAKLRGEKS